jgi:hypothetical protein
MIKQKHLELSKKLLDMALNAKVLSDLAFARNNEKPNPTDTQKEAAYYAMSEAFELTSRAILDDVEAIHAINDWAVSLEKDLEEEGK